MRKGMIYRLLTLLIGIVCSLSQTALGAILPPTPKYFSERWGFINTTGKVVVEPRFERLGALAEGLAAVRIGAYEGFVDRSGKIIIEPKYSAVGDFSDGLARVNPTGTVSETGEPRAGKWGFIDSSGGMAIAPLYEEAGDFAEGLAPVKSFGFWGYIDADGKRVSDFIFDYARNFSDGLAFVIRNDQPGYINTRMDGPLSPWEHSLRYEQYGDFSEGLAPVCAKQRWGFINQQGTLTIPCQFFDVRGFSEDLAAVQSGAKWGFINKKGQLVIPAQFAHAGSFRKGMAYVEFPDHRKGYIDSSGKLLFTLSFAGMYDFSEGLARVHHRAGWGYIDETGKMLIEPEFDVARPFSDGLACAAAGERFGYINPAGQWVIQPRFAGGSEFRDGFTLVATEKWKENSIQWLDRHGKVVRTFDDYLQTAGKGMPGVGEQYVLAPTGLHIRKQPNPYSQSVGIIPYGKKVKILKRTATTYTTRGITGKWVMAEYNHLKGYVFDGFLSHFAAPRTDDYSDLGEYLTSVFRDRKMETIWFSNREMMKVTFGQSGEIALMAGVMETDNASLVYWLPRVTMREVFLLVQNLVYKNSLVLSVNDKPLSTEVPLMNLTFPGEINQIKLTLGGDGWNYSIWLEKEKYGYVRIIEG